MNRIEKRISHFIDFTQPGSCTAFAYFFCKNALTENKNEYFVVEGLIRIDGKSFNHTWIQEGQTIIDPTLAQFNLSKNAIYDRVTLKRYSPKKYVNLNDGEITVFFNVLKIK